MKIILPKSLWYGFLVGTTVTLAVAAAAWASFTGPDRTTTQTVRDPDGDRWYCDKSGFSRCWFGGGNPCPDEGGSHPSTGSQIAVCGWVADDCGCNEAYKEETISLPPATVGGAAVCADSGEGGWCKGGASLELTANEPLAGQVIQLIEGDPVGILCDPADAASVNCSWAGADGNFPINYWALSSYGDTSEMASGTWKVDTQAPSASLVVSGGEAGGGGWYLNGPVSVSVTGSDSLSGVVSEDVSVDGGRWSSSLDVAGDGVHTVSGRVRDAAGNQRTNGVEIRIDGSPPALNSQLDGTSGLNGWYISSVTASATASDALSGVDRSEVKVGSGSWSTGSLQVSGDGNHSLQFRALDVAGNETLDSTELRIDATPPNFTPELSGTEGLDGWYVSPVSVFASASDNLSGVAAVEVRSGGGEWELGPVVIAEDGTHSLELRASDLAGNQQTADGPTIKIDTHVPESFFVNPPEGSETWAAGIVPLFGQSSDQTSGVSSVETSFDGGASWTGVTDLSASWWTTWDTSLIRLGTFAVLARARDVAGNLESTAAITLNIDNVPPDVDIPDEWLAGQTGQLSVEEVGVGLGGVDVEIRSGINVIFEASYGPEQYPAAIEWNEAAGPGEYTVIVTAWDLVGNVGRDSGIIVVAGEFEQPKSDEPAVEIGAANDKQPPAQIVRVASSEAAEPTRHPWLWPTIGWIGLMSAIGAAKLSDPRTGELRKLQRDIRIIRKTLKD